MILRPKKHSATPPAVTAPPALPPMLQQAARVEAELADARRDLVAAEAEVAAARSAYDAAADGARVSEAVAAKNRIREAETLVDVVGRKVARLAAELPPLLAGAADVAAAVDREQLRAAAQAAQEEYAAEFGATMPEVTRQMRRLIRVWAQAELAREAAAAAGAHLPRADAFRDLDGTPRVEIGRRALDLWLNETCGQPFADAYQADVRVDANGVGRVQGRTHISEATRRRRYDEITFRPATPGQLAPVLAEMLVLPSAMAGAPAGWSPLKAGTSPRAVLDALDALEARQDAPRSTPAPRTERVPVEPARDVRVNPDPPPFREWFGPYGRDPQEAIAASREADRTLPRGFFRLGRAVAPGS